MSTCLEYREVIPHQTRPEKWTEWTLNTGGTPSTLQDIKVQQRAGGFCYNNHPHRFIYWRTNHDVLELVEDSLNQNLDGNHLRYRFTDTPILEGVSIHETYNNVVILVATVSSVHRLTYTHPDKLSKTEIGDVSVPSIFKDATWNAARDPTTYYVTNTSPNLPHTAASCLNSKGDAVFSLAFNSGSILIIHLEPLSGAASTIELRPESIVPRFLSGITDAFLGRTNEDLVAVSMVLHSIKKEMFLFSISRNGQLRAWSCEKSHCLMICDVSDRKNNNMLGGQSHVIRKAVDIQGNLVLCIFFCYAENSHIVIVQPELKAGMFQCTSNYSISTSANYDLVEVMLSNKGRDVWCIWVTGNGDTAVSHTSHNSGTWSWITVEPPPPIELTLDPMLDPGQQYIDAIFQPGLFSISDISKALSINRRNVEVNTQYNKRHILSDLKQKVCMSVEAEIQAEVSQYEITDEEYLNIAYRHWSNFYSCCVQYHQTGTQALGLLALPSRDILMLKKSGISILRTLDSIESLIFGSSQYCPEEGVKELMNLLQQIDPGVESWHRLDIAFQQAASPDTVLQDIASDIIRDKGTIPAIYEINGSNLQHSIETVLQYVAQIANFTNGVDNCFHSELGVSIVINTLKQLTSIRLSVCRNILLLLKLYKCHSLEHLSLHTQDQCRQLYMLHWASSELSGSLKQFVLSCPGITQNSILDSATSLACAIWPTSQSKEFPKFLFETKQHIQLQHLARLAPYDNWQLLLAESLLETGEPYKAFDLVLSNNASVLYYLQVIRKFELQNYPDLVLALTNIAICEAEPDDQNLATLHSISFLHHLKLGHYEDAYRSLEANPVDERREDCLRQLVLALINARCLDTLLMFPYRGMLMKLESLLETRARSLEIANALVYYNILYSFHIKNENYRKAASVMLEQGLRSDDNEIQKNCLAVCLNTMLLVAPEYAWIVKPTCIAHQEENTELLEIKDIRREFHLACARCKLQNCATDTTPRDVIGLCVAEGHYKTALRLCHLHGLSYNHPLEALTAACAHVSDNNKAWKWLLQNEISDLVIGDSNAVVVAWRLLEYLLLKYEVDKDSTLHKVVAGKLMSLHVFLPLWLEASYKTRNPGELLRLYFIHGNLEKSSELACELLEAAVSQGKEYFGMETSLQHISRPLCLPMHTIDRLLFELQYHKMDVELRSCLDKYITIAMRITQDKTEAVM